MSDNRNFIRSKKKEETKGLVFIRHVNVVYSGLLNGVNVNKIVHLQIDVNPSKYDDVLHFKILNVKELVIYEEFLSLKEVLISIKSLDDGVIYDFDTDYIEVKERLITYFMSRVK